jgi:hypothetical protein
MSELDLYVGRTARLTAIVCQGLLGEGERCGKVYKASGDWSVLDQARAAGWRIGRLPDGTPDAMCPACARPDPATVALCRDLKQSVRRG